MGNWEWKKFVGVAQISAGGIPWNERRRAASNLTEVLLMCNCGNNGLLGGNLCWIILLLILFCGCGQNQGCECDNRCC